MKILTEPILVDKPLGATPLEALHLLRAVRPELAAVKLAYAGRLDPMASGLLPVLSGEQLKHQEDFWHLAKEYQASVALGLTTDSYDLLGLVQIFPPSEIPTNKVQAAAQSLVGKLNLAVPVFSSSRMPVRTMAISEITVQQIDQMTLSQLAERAGRRVALVRGNFRQAATLAAWRALGQAQANRNVPTVQLKINCASGTYVRSLAHELGRRLGTGGVLIDLRRTAVGPWRVDGSTTLSLVWPQ